MPISKRLRFEIFRRDQHRCHYCGATPEQNELAVDHVIPQALGGSDDPTNLVTACRDCNAGKTSTSPDEPLVEAVADDAIRWAKALERAAEISRQTARDEDQTFRSFALGIVGAAGDTAWRLPSLESVGGELEARSTVLRFHRLGLSVDDQVAAMTTACFSHHIPEDRVWRYFCGICWRKIHELQDIARSIIETGDL